MANSVNESGTAHRAGSLREVVAIFNDQDQLQGAVDELQAQGFDRANISTVADCRTIEKETGHGYVDVRDIEDDGEVPRRVHVSKTSLGDAEGVLIGIAIYIPTCIVAANLASRGVSDGALALGVLIAAAIGGLLGWWFARRLDGGYRRRIREQVEHGGIVLWVSIHSLGQEMLATEILRSAGGRDVHPHDLPILVKPIPGWRGPSYNMSFMRLLGM